MYHGFQPFSTQGSRSLSREQRSGLKQARAMSYVGISTEIVCEEILWGTNHKHTTINHVNVLGSPVLFHFVTAEIYSCPSLQLYMNIMENELLQIASLLQHAESFEKNQKVCVSIKSKRFKTPRFRFSIDNCLLFVLPWRSFH